MKPIVLNKRSKAGVTAPTGELALPKSLRRRDKTSIKTELEPLIHLIAPGVICNTEHRGHSRPQGRSLTQISLDATHGFIPVWEKDTILRWRFRERSMVYFEDVSAAKTEIRRLMAEAILAWGSAAPVAFKYDDDLWDFEIVVQGSDDCSGSGCVLASGFFPDGGRHEFNIYPKLFTQVPKEQVDTLTHELGHVFGLRHFFALVDESQWPAEIFGRHEKFSIMNYGEFSELSEFDKEDLTLLYRSVWSGSLTHINGTPIKQVRPYSRTTSAQLSFAEIEALGPLRPRLNVPAHSKLANRGQMIVQSRSDILGAGQK